MNRPLLNLPRYFSQLCRSNGGTSQSKNTVVNLLTKQLRVGGCRVISNGVSTYKWQGRKREQLVKQVSCNFSASATQPKTENPLAGASATGTLKEAVEVQWKNGDITHYPYLWLRDNCYCPKCKKHGRDVFQRDFLMQDLNPDSTPKDVKVCNRWGFDRGNQ